MNTAPWRLAPEPLEAREWQVLWRSNDALDLRVEVCESANGRVHRVCTGHPQAQASGAVVVCVRMIAGRPHVLFVLQRRTAPGVTLWELPRGAADADDDDPLATGLRELHEETGMEALASELLGTVYPDSGVLGGEVAVVWARAASGEARADGVETDEVCWVPQDRITDLIAQAQIRDGITLSALALVHARGLLGEPRA